MRHCNKSQIDQEKVLVDNSYMIAALITSTLMISLLKVPLL